MLEIYLKIKEKELIMLTMTHLYWMETMKFKISSNQKVLKEIKMRLFLIFKIIENRIYLLISDDKCNVIA